MSASNKRKLTKTLLVATVVCSSVIAVVALSSLLQPQTPNTADGWAAADGRARARIANHWITNGTLIGESKVEIVRKLGKPTKEFKNHIYYSVDTSGRFDLIRFAMDDFCVSFDSRNIVTNLSFTD